MTTKNSKRSSATGQFVNSHAGFGHIARLTDPGPSQAVDQLKKRLTANPELAKAWLFERGFITKTGKLPKRYGG